MGFQLQSYDLLDGEDAADLAMRFRRIPLTNPFIPGETYNCPMDDGAVTVVAFSYAARPDVALWVKTNGCQTVSNGSIFVGGLDPPA
ncbi:MAG: hypothetical protein FWF28_08720 [Micrococcales bacterium]|nr:hypothetical protein [Micrococcales bacterium]